MQITVTKPQAQLALEALNNEFMRLEGLRRETRFPEDQPLIEKQQLLAEMMADIRAAMRVESANA